MEDKITSHTDRRSIVSLAGKVAGGLLLFTVASCERDQDEGLIARREAEGLDPGHPAGSAGGRDEGTSLTLEEPSLNEDALVDPNNQPMAKALGYVPSAERTLMRTDDRYGIPAASQFCNNCEHYRATREIRGEQVGDCELIPTGRVLSGGWCTAWFPKETA